MVSRFGTRGLEEFEKYHPQPLNRSWSSQDPRSSSVRSLVPVENDPGKRSLILVYIHGFVYGRQPFRSFPSHLHNYLVVSLADTHLVYTKIYTEKIVNETTVEHARHDFITWLLDTERSCGEGSAGKDIILVAHSMGGILAAEIALGFSWQIVGEKYYRRHILGIVNFDCPFLGLQPKLLFSRFNRFFSKTPKKLSWNMGNSKQELESDLAGRNMTSSEQSSVLMMHAGPSIIRDFALQSNSRAATTPVSPGPAHAPQEPPRADITPYHAEYGSPNPQHGSCWSDFHSFDPYYDPPLEWDIGKARRAAIGETNNDLLAKSIYSVARPFDRLTRAMRFHATYANSHLIFPKMLVAYKELQDRYSKIRALEDVDTAKDKQAKRIRFVNYYTASTGRPKKTKRPPQRKPAAQYSPFVEAPVAQESRHDPLSPLRSPMTRSSEGHHRNVGSWIETPQTSGGPLAGEVTRSSITPVFNHLDAVLDPNEDREDITLEGGDRRDNLMAEITSSPTSMVPELLENNESAAPVQTATDQARPPSPSSPPPRYSSFAYNPSSRRDKFKALVESIKNHRKSKKDEDLASRAEKARIRSASKKAKSNRKKMWKTRRKEKRTAARKLKAEAKEEKRQGKKMWKVWQKENRKVARKSMANAKEKGRRQGTKGKENLQRTLISHDLVTSSPTANVPADQDEVAQNGDNRDDDELETTTSRRTKSSEEPTAAPGMIKYFCRQPPKINHRTDPLWVPIFMQESNPRTAHRTIFKISRRRRGDNDDDHHHRYVALLTDVGSRIQEWVEESVECRDGENEDELVLDYDDQKHRGFFTDVGTGERVYDDYYYSFSV